MTREDIEKMSVVSPYCFQTDREERWFEIGCIEGLKSADAEPNLESLWHEAKEKPRAKEWILVQFTGGDYEALALDELGVETWSDWWCDNYKVISWAYISDLLPKQFGNSKQVKGGKR